MGRSGRTSSGSELALGLGLMGRGLLGFEVGACLWLVLVLCRLCVACLSGVAWL